MNYSEKLKDPRWQKKRLRILERDKFKCVKCGNDKDMLTINHLKYSGEPWDVDDDCLETLCPTCNAEFTAFDFIGKCLESGYGFELITTWVAVPIKDGVGEGGRRSLCKLRGFSKLDKINKKAIVKILRSAGIEG